MKTTHLGSITVIHRIKKITVVLLLALAISFGISISNVYAQSSSQDSAPAGLRELGEFSSLLFSTYSFSPDGTLLVIGDKMGGIEVRDATNGKLVRQFPRNHFFNLLGPHSAGVTALAISSDGKMLISGSDDKTVKVWDLQNGNLLHNITDFQNSIISLAFRKDKSFVTGEASQTFKIWSVDQGSLIKVISNPDSNYALNLSSDGEWLWSMGTELKFWRIEDTTYVHHSITTSSGHAYSQNNSWHENPSGLKTFETVDLSPTSNQIIAFGECTYRRRRCVNVFDVEKNVWYDEDQPSRILNAVALSPDKHRLATSGYYAWTDTNHIIGNEIIVEDFKLGQTVARYKFSDGEAVIRKIAFSPDTKKLLTIDEDRNVGIWKIPD